MKLGARRWFRRSHKHSTSSAGQGERGGTTCIISPDAPLPGHDPLKKGPKNGSACINAESYRAVMSVVRHG